MTLNPFNLSGPEFLTLYAFGFAAAIFAGMALPAWLRPEGRDQALRDVDALAYLAGGARRFTDAVLARLLARGALAVEKRELVARAPDAGESAAERTVLRLPKPISVHSAESALASEAEPVERRLVAAGLLIDAAAARRLRWRQTAPYLALLGFGAIKWVVGVWRDRPVGFLTALLLLTAVLAVVRWHNVDRRTRAGERLLRHEQARADRLRRAPMPHETDQAVALFGTAVLAGSAYAGYHDLRRPTGGDGGGSASSDGGDSGGGDGGGGGGCGGCGS